MLRRSMGLFRDQSPVEAFRRGLITPRVWCMTPASLRGDMERIRILRTLANRDPSLLFGIYDYRASHHDDPVMHSLRNSMQIDPSRLFCARGICKEEMLASLLKQASSSQRAFFNSPEISRRKVVAVATSLDEVDALKEWGCFTILTSANKAATTACSETRHLALTKLQQRAIHRSIHPDYITTPEGWLTAHGQICERLTQHRIPGNSPTLTIGVESTAQESKLVAVSTSTSPGRICGRW